MTQFVVVPIVCMIQYPDLPFKRNILYLVRGSATAYDTFCVVTTVVNISPVSFCVVNSQTMFMCLYRRQFINV